MPEDFSMHLNDHQRSKATIDDISNLEKAISSIRNSNIKSTLKPSLECVLLYLTEHPEGVQIISKYRITKKLMSIIKGADDSLIKSQAMRIVAKIMTEETTKSDIMIKDTKQIDHFDTFIKYLFRDNDRIMQELASEILAVLTEDNDIIQTHASDLDISQLLQSFDSSPKDTKMNFAKIINNLITNFNSLPSTTQKNIWDMYERIWENIKNSQKFLRKLAINIFKLFLLTEERPTNFYNMLSKSILKLFKVLQSIRYSDLKIDILDVLTKVIVAKPLQHHKEDLIRLMMDHHLVLFKIINPNDDAYEYALRLIEQLMEEKPGNMHLIKALKSKNIDDYISILEILSNMIKEHPMANPTLIKVYHKLLEELSNEPCQSQLKSICEESSTFRLSKSSRLSALNLLNHLLKRSDVLKTKITGIRFILDDILSSKPSVDLQLVCIEIIEQLMTYNNNSFSIIYCIYYLFLALVKFGHQENWNLNYTNVDDQYTSCKKDSVTNEKYLTTNKFEVNEDDVVRKACITLKGLFLFRKPDDNYEETSYVAIIEKNAHLFHKVLKSTSNNDLKCIILETIAALCKVKTIPHSFIKYGCLTYLRDDNLDSLIHEKKIECMNSIFREYLPAKFYYANHLDEMDRIHSGFYATINKRCFYTDMCSFVDKCPIYTMFLVNMEDYTCCDNLIMTIEDKMKKIEKQYPDLHTYRRNLREEVEFIMKRDANLNKILVNVKSKICNHERNVNHTISLRERAKILAEFISEQMKSPNCYNDEAIEHCTKKHLNELKYERKRGIIKLGDVKVGSFFERALLFKVLADQLLIPVTIRRNQHHMAWIEMTCFEVKLKIRENIELAKLKEKC